ncbi:hypothetical protein OQ252_08445 [Acetobacter farinalis]|uniref:Uncharacterized protein n=1 Tax=Acetobacter farinalis TaxID=1260984 RepID=A0ABT3Q825_9PROT|nr:hypothetical protein [Acetobacter farinalis]MCX2561420.1 hypothetical protein [Acetobacter farinalis]NHO29988.1 hypothetical protein [Acetobacter farinalis]
MKTELALTIRTTAARRALRRHGRESLSDLKFLEKWETTPSNTAASILRAGQIRRTNPDLMREIAHNIHQNSERKNGHRSR